MYSIKIQKLLKPSACVFTMLMVADGTEQNFRHGDMIAMVRGANEPTASERLQDELIESDAASWAASRRKGGRLNRSETMTMRLDPKLNFLVEMAGRAQRRTKSSYAEWAVEQGLSQTWVPGAADWNGQPQSIADLADRLWDVDEADRLAKLAFHAPTLMTHDEQVIWKVIINHHDFWKGKWAQMGPFAEEWKWTVQESSLLFDRVRDEFELIKRVASGDAKASELPETCPRTRKKAASPPKAALDDFSSDLDDDCPF